MDPKATMTSKGQVTIPQEIREALGLTQGTQLSFELSDGELRVRPISRNTWADLWALSAGMAKRPRVDVKGAILAAVRERLDG